MGQPSDFFDEPARNRFPNTKRALRTDLGTAVTANAAIVIEGQTPVVNGKGAGRTDLPAGGAQIAALRIDNRFGQENLPGKSLIHRRHSATGARQMKVFNAAAGVPDHLPDAHRFLHQTHFPHAPADGQPAPDRPRPDDTRPHRGHTYRCCP